MHVDHSIDPLKLFKESEHLKFIDKDTSIYLILIFVVIYNYKSLLINNFFKWKDRSQGLQPSF